MSLRAPLRHRPLSLPGRRMFAAVPHRSTQPSTFQNQSHLPRLPVPDLRQSLDGYLTNLDHVSPNNWLNDTLWLALAYHTWRAPLPVNSNWWLCFAPDPTDSQPPVVAQGGQALDPSSVGTPDPNPPGDVPKGSQGGGAEWIKANGMDPPVLFDQVTSEEWITPHQIRRAAWLARRFAEFREKLQKEQVLPDTARNGTPFCMSQYLNIFNLARVPLPQCDAFSTPQPKATHISLLIGDRYYSVDIFAPTDGVPEPLPVAEIESRFKAAVDDAKARKDAGEPAPQVGILTGDDRDSWAKMREHLNLLSPSNRPTLTSLSSSLLTLSLDPYTLPSIPPPSGDPLRLPSVDAHMRNSATGIRGGGNRWFDKAVSVVVETNGRAGIMGEHSPVDALIPSIAAEYALAEGVDEKQFAVPAKIGAGGEGWERLEWVVDEAILGQIEEVRGKTNKLIEDSDSSQLWWGEYAADWIKRTAKQSPDAYIQQALQLAWFLDQGYPTATYETASTRGMLHGRTDVIRSLSPESRAFVLSMTSSSASGTTVEERYALLSAACSAHNTLTKNSSSGKGFDRHLMGLKVQLRAGEGHAIFDDELYAKSQEWKLSTSGLSAGKKFMGTGFGAAWPDGYGINYLAGPHLIKFGIESKFSCDKTSTQRFKHHVVQALRDMREVCESVAGRAKL
ncbi:hypothetical protein IAR50_007207 [Cryptococcus sp. DSM 104548]